MTPSPDLLVIGGGIVGTAIAERASREGLRVDLADPGPLGSGATAAGMGHIVVMDDSPAQIALTRFSQTRWDELRDTFPDNVETEHCGTIWVAADDEEMEEVLRKQAVYADCGIESEAIDQAALLKYEPHLAPTLAGGLRVPGDSVVYPPTAAKFLWKQTAARGGVWHRTKVESLEGNTATFTNGERLSAGAIVNAAGQYAVNLMPALPIQWKKGHLAITDRYPGYVTHQLIELGYLKSAHTAGIDSVAFNAQPRRTGQILLGSSRQVKDPTPDIRPDVLQRMIERAAVYLPDIGDLHSIRCWTGQRAATPDHLPLIGPHPEHASWWVATGHEGLGITTSMGTAELIVHQLMDTACPIDPAPYRLDGRLLEMVRG